MLLSAMALRKYGAGYLHLLIANDSLATLTQNRIVIPVSLYTFKISGKSPVL